MAVHAVSEKPYELAYEASIRAIETQATLVESLRSRAGTMLAATALVTSFFGGQALAPGGSKPGEDQLTSADVLREVALQYESTYDSNARQIRILEVCFRLAIVFLVAEVAFWLAALTGGAL